MFSPQGDGQVVIAFLLFHCVKHCGMYRGLKALNLEQLRFKMKVKEKVTQSSPILCYPMDYTVHGILQARILERLAFPFSRGSSQPRDRTQVSCIAGSFFTIFPPGKTKNTGVGSLSLSSGSSWPRNPTSLLTWNLITLNK